MCFCVADCNVLSRESNIKKDYAFIIEEIGIVYMDWLFF